MKIALCGSMTSAKKILQIKQELEKQKHFVIVPANINEHAKHNVAIENKQEKIKLDVIRSYFEEIKKINAILVVNEEKNGIKNYLGGNSLIEMAFAYVLKKKIFLLNSIPQINYSDEIEAMQPIILNNNLNKIKNYE